MKTYNQICLHRGISDLSGADLRGANFREADPEYVLYFSPKEETSNENL